MICKVNVIENISTHSQTLSFGLCLAYLKSSNHQRRLLVMVRTNYIWHKTDFLAQIFTKLCQICTGTESDQVWRVYKSLRDVWLFFIKRSDNFWCLTGGPNWPPWGSEDFLCLKGRSQLTFLKKWSHFVPDGGPNWPFWKSDHISCQTASTDLLEKVITFRVKRPQLTFLRKWSHFVPSKGPNWPFWKKKWPHFVSNGPTDLLEKVIIFRVWRGHQLNWPLL